MTGLDAARPSWGPRLFTPPLFWFLTARVILSQLREGIQKACVMLSVSTSSVRWRTIPVFTGKEHRCNPNVFLSTSKATWVTHEVNIYHCTCHPSFLCNLGFPVNTDEKTYCFFLAPVIFNHFHNREFVLPHLSCWVGSDLVCQITVTSGQTISAL